MPCRDDWGPATQETRHGMTIADFEAVLCGLFTALEGREQINDMLSLWLSNVDWKEVGVKRGAVEAWWKKHKAEYAARLAREAAEQYKAKLKASALAKLSEEEKAALGIK